MMMVKVEVMTYQMMKYMAIKQIKERVEVYKPRTKEDWFEIITGVGSLKTPETKEAIGTEHCIYCKVEITNCKCKKYD